MKFGKDIAKHAEESRVDPSWYVDYRGLKKLIKAGVTQEEFQRAFQAELDKVKEHTAQALPLDPRYRQINKTALDKISKKFDRHREANLRALNRKTVKREFGAELRGRLLASAAAAFCAEAISLPIDTTKVRLQLMKTAPGQTAAYSGMVDCALKVVKNEGPTGLFKGMAPALLRQVSYTSLCMVIFEPLRDLMCRDPKKDMTFSKRLAAGGAAGAVGIMIMNPTEVLKTQIQGSSSSKTMRGVAQRVYQNQGLLGFWAGVQPNVVRTFLVNAAELGTYDGAKDYIAAHHLVPPGLPAHLTASGVAASVSAVVSTPVDVVKTRLMNEAGSGIKQKGILTTIQNIFSEEGPKALYKGFVPVVCRKLVYCAIFFTVYEETRALYRQL